jgi:hypothetical protein
MQHRIIFQEDFLVIEYNVVTDMIVANWKGAQTENTTMRGYEKIMQASIDHFCTALVDNHQFIVGLWAGASDWVAREWFPDARAKGLVYMAMVYSEHKFSHLSTSKTIQLICSPDVKGFDFAHFAAQWIEDMRSHS